MGSLLSNGGWAALAGIAAGAMPSDTDVTAITDEETAEFGHPLELLSAVFVEGSSGPDDPVEERCEAPETVKLPNVLGTRAGDAAALLMVNDAIDCSVAPLSFECRATRPPTDSVDSLRGTTTAGNDGTLRLRFFSSRIARNCAASVASSNDVLGDAAVGVGSPLRLVLPLSDPNVAPATLRDTLPMRSDSGKITAAISRECSRSEMLSIIDTVSRASSWCRWMCGSCCSSVAFDPADEARCIAPTTSLEEMCSMGSSAVGQSAAKVIDWR